MKRRSLDVIEFPANPFVALADFVIVLLLVLTLVLLHQSISSNRVIERLAVATAQEKLQKSLGVPILVDSNDLTNSLKEDRLVLKHADGDLQRFRFPGSMFYEAEQPVTTSVVAQAALLHFGAILASDQGDPHIRGSGLFKRISIEGNADRSEGDDARVWTLSLERAQQAAALLQQKTNLAPGVIEVTGRGCWGDYNLEVTPDMSTDTRTRVRAYNRHLDVVVYYSGPLAREHQEAQARVVRPSR